MPGDYKVCIDVCFSLLSTNNLFSVFICIVCPCLWNELWNSNMIISFPRRLTSVYQGKFSPLENIQLVKFLLHILGCSHAEFVSLYNSSVNQRSTADTGKRLAKCTSLWEIQALAFTMLGEAFSRAGSVFPVEIWQSTVEVLYSFSFVYIDINMLVMCIYLYVFFELGS